MLREQLVKDIMIVKHWKYVDDEIEISGHLNN